MRPVRTPNTFLSELSHRARLFRISYPLTQQELADKAGVSLRTIQYFENSNDIRLESFIRILSALDLAKQLDELIPDMEIRPSVLLQKSRGKEKQRVRKSRKSDAGRTFRWGDEK